MLFMKLTYFSTVRFEEQNSTAYFIKGLEPENLCFMEIIPSVQLASFHFLLGDTL